MVLDATSSPATTSNATTSVAMITTNTATMHKQKRRNSVHTNHPHGGGNTVTLGGSSRRFSLHHKSRSLRDLFKQPFLPHHSSSSSKALLISNNNNHNTKFQDEGSSRTCSTASVESTSYRSSVSEDRAELLGACLQPHSVVAEPVEDAALLFSTTPAQSQQLESESSSPNAQTNNHNKNNNNKKKKKSRQLGQTNVTKTEHESSSLEAPSEEDLMSHSLSTATTATHTTHTTTTGSSPRRNPSSSTNSGVRFAHPMSTIVGTIPCLKEVSTEERWETWWCPHEYQAIRLAAKYSTKQIRKCDTLSAECVQQAFSYVVEACKQDKDEQDDNKKSGEDSQELPQAEDLAEHDDDDCQEEASMQVSRVPQEGNLPSSRSCSAFASSSKNNPTMMDEDDSACALLESWCTSKLPTRGLEKYVSQQHKKDRMDLMNESRRVVAQLSSSSSTSSSCTGSDSSSLSSSSTPSTTETSSNTPSKEARQRLEQEIAQVYGKHCQYAHMFARIIGEADARAAQQDALDMPNLYNTSNHTKANLCWAEQRRRSFHQQRSILQRNSSMHSQNDDQSRCSSVGSQDSMPQQHRDSRSSTSPLRRRRCSQSGAATTCNSNGTPSSSSHKNWMADESVKASISSTNGGNSTSNSPSNGGPMTHLQRSFSRRCLLQRRASMKGQQQLQQQQGQEQTQPLSTQTPRGSQELLQRSDSRRALLIQHRQNSFHYQPPPGHSSSTPAAGNGLMTRSNSRRSLMQLQRQESMKRHKTATGGMSPMTTTSTGTTGTTGAMPRGGRRFSLAGATPAVVSSSHATTNSNNSGSADARAMPSRRMFGMGERQSSVPNIFPRYSSSAIVASPPVTTNPILLRRTTGTNVSATTTSPGRGGVPMELD